MHRQIAQLLDWIDQRHLDLSTLRQADLDSWLSERRVTTRYTVRGFVAWAARRQLAPPLDVPSVRGTGPSINIDADERWAVAERLLHDTALNSTLRLTGLFVVVYGQVLARITCLQRQAVTSTVDGEARIAFGKTPVVLLDPIAGILRGHVDKLPEDERWLFPGLLPGRPISTSYAQVALNRHHVLLKPSRLAALEQLGTQLPASVLADLLGIEIGTASRWVAKSAGDWGHYIAARPATAAQRS